MTREEAEFPASLGKVAPRQLAAHGLTRFDQLADRTERELLAIHRVGPKGSPLGDLTGRGGSIILPRKDWRPGSVGLPGLATDLAPQGP
jgi:hypothetical protein